MATRLTRNGARVDNAAPLTLAHDGQQRTRDQEGRVDVLREAMAPVVNGGGRYWGARQYAIVVDEDVHGVEVIDDTVDGLEYRLSVAGVKADRVALVIIHERTERQQEGGQRYLVCVMDDNAEAVLQEHAHRGLAEHAGRSGHLYGKRTNAVRQRQGETDGLT